MNELKVSDDLYQKVLLDLVLMQSAGKTFSVIDRKRNALLLRALEGEQREWAIQWMMRVHRDRLNYLTVTQRRWQRETRRPSRARHHDSIAIRERYVRIAA